jgi:sugar lactone lactonase YvrE
MIRRYKKIFLLNVFYFACMHLVSLYAQPYYDVSTFAGSGTAGNADGTGISANFSGPVGLAIDVSGNIYVADTYNHSIRKITPAGIVSTLAGTGSSGSANGIGTAASFNTPTGVAVDASGNVYVADQYNNKIRKITPAGVVTTFAGSGSTGSANGTGTAASFFFPYGLAVDTSDNIYVADLNNHRIRKITPAGVVTTFAGSSLGYANGTGTAAKFGYPAGVTVDASGNVFVTDSYNQRIRKITSAGVVSTFAGSGSLGSTDATGAAASFNYPYGITIDAFGNLYVAEQSNHKIRKITSAAVVTTVAGTGTQGSNDGAAASATFNFPVGAVADSSGSKIYIGDSNNNKIRLITDLAPATKTISGPANVASGSNGVSYSVSANAGYTYSWTVPSGATITSGQGTNSITVDFGSTGGTVSVTETNSFGSTTSSVSVTVASMPVSQTITGPSNVASGSTGITYSISVNSGSTYNWTVPAGATITSGQGTDSIKVSFGSTGGTVSVMETNFLGSATSSLAVSINAPTGISSVQNSLTSVEVYPNPFRAEVNITINASEVIPVILKVINMEGKVVYESGAFKTNERIILGKELPASGIYTVMAISDKGMKVIKVERQE